MAMQRSRLFALFVLAGMAGPAAMAATPDAQTQKIVDEVRTLATKARKERSADPWLLQAMDDLVRRYYWPWRRSVADESFSDGDYSKNPAWEVAAGSFWVDKALGLRSQAKPAPAADKDKAKLKDVFKEAVLAEIAGPKPAAAVAAAEIYLPAKITNAFALEAGFSLHHPPAEHGRVEFGLFEGTRRERGYVLAIASGRENVAELLRVTASGAAVIERVTLPAAIPAGELQKLSWRRDPEGGMLVLLNDKTLMQTADRGLMAPFRSLGLANRGGDIAIKQLALSDAG
jgi:hypothetical protein